MLALDLHGALDSIKEVVRSEVKKANNMDFAGCCMNQGQQSALMLKST
jgi:hypothetical protein